MTAFPITVSTNDFNSGLLLEEGRALWGAALLAVNTVQSGDPPAIGQLDNRPIVAAEFVFAGGTVVDQAAVNALVAAHNPASFSTRQLLDQRQANARAALQALGADGVRVTGMPDLAEIVATIVEALDLDVDL